MAFGYCHRHSLSRSVIFTTQAPKLKGWNVRLLLQTPLRKRNKLLSPDPIAHVSPWCLCRAQDETSPSALRSWRRELQKLSSCSGRALSSPASIGGLDRLVADAATEVQPQVLPLCCARIRYGNRSLGEPRSRAKSARPTPIVAFSPQHHKLYQATLSYRVCAVKKKEKKFPVQSVSNWAV
jgi:hypothetical protein